MLDEGIELVNGPSASLESDSKNCGKDRFETGQEAVDTCLGIAGINIKDSRNFATTTRNRYSERLAGPSLFIIFVCDVNGISTARRLVTGVCIGIDKIDQSGSDIGTRTLVRYPIAWNLEVISHTIDRYRPDIAMSHFD